MIHLLRFLRAVAQDGVTDRDLLDRFTRTRDEDAFALIVQRYSPGVWAACQRLAGHDAEDAFQAVFLTLARKASSVRGSLPAWLHGVVRRVAANLRKHARRRTALEMTAARPDEVRPEDVSQRETLALLDEELARLPESYRAVLIVCCLEGRSRDDAATQLGWSEGQVKGRLERGRELLRQRLQRRGMDLDGILLAALSSATPTAPVLPAAALLTAGAAVSPAILSLTNGVIQAMLFQKLKVAAVVLMVTAVAGAVTYGTVPLGTEIAPEKLVSAPPEPPMENLNRWEKLLQDRNLTPRQRAAYEQIAKLHTVKLERGEHPGMIEIPSSDRNSKVPTDVLYKMGIDVLPMLAEALDDETPTATVTDNRGRDRKVWQVNELVALLVWRIAERDFVICDPGKEVGIREIRQQPKDAPAFRKQVLDWHSKFAAKTPLERKIADVADPWFRNRFDAIIWLGNTKAKEGRPVIAGRVDAFYADPKRGYDSLTRAEMSHCALALGQIGDQEGLPAVRKVCRDMSYWIETYGNSGSSMLEDLFRAYQGLALLGHKNAALVELTLLEQRYGAQFEPSYRKEFADRLKVAKDW
jgi:RNA polymerase sigma factor (sigma-70 family)